MTQARPDVLVAVLDTRPLRLHVSLHNPDTNTDVTWVPRTLRPLGAFVHATLRTLAGEAVYETARPKAKRKLDPDADDSYLALDPGYSFGAVLELQLGALPGGEYALEVTYDNEDYTGTPDRPVGRVRCTEERSVVLDDPA